MFLRLLAGLFMVCGLTLGVNGITHAQNYNHIPTPVHQSAPELDPSAIGGGIMMLAGGVLLLSERRRNRR